MEEWYRSHSPDVMPGAMLMKYGPEDYVGAALCVRSTLYFDNASTPEVRAAICDCFEAFELLAKGHLEWLWREEPPSGPDNYPYGKAPSMRAMMASMEKDDAVSFVYKGGEKKEDASAWLFYASGRRGWQAKKKKTGLDFLRFSTPLSFIEKNPTLYQRTFLEFANKLNAKHGHANFALNLSPVRVEPNESTEAFMTSKMNALDVGSIGHWSHVGIADHIKTVGWLTAINHEMAACVGGISRLRDELPVSWFAKYAYSNGVVVQAGPEPVLASVELDSKPAIYVLPNALFKPLRIPELDALHYPSKDGEPRIWGLPAQEWLERFDIAEDELLAYKAKLLMEPKLSATTVLAEQL